MRIKVNSLNLGLFYESCIICSADYEEYFKQTASYLEKKYAVKTFIYVYDRDALTKRVKLILSTCYSNIFMLTAGVAENAAAGKNPIFREVYAFTQKHNPNSLSLSQIDKTQIDYSIDFPDDMRSFAWLHRKDYYLGNYSPEMLAGEIRREIRLGFSNREQKRFKRYNSIPLYALYDSYSSMLKWGVALLFAPLILYLASLLIGITVEDPALWQKLLFTLLSLVGYVLCGVSIIAMAVTPAVMVTKRLRAAEDRINISTTFLRFRQITVKRLLVLLFLVLSVITASAYEIISNSNFAIYKGESEALRQLSCYLPISLVHFTYLTDLLLLTILSGKAPHRLSFTRQKRIYGFTVGIALAVTLFIVLLILFKTFTA